MTIINDVFLSTFVSNGLLDEYQIVINYIWIPILLAPSKVENVEVDGEDDLNHIKDVFKPKVIFSLRELIVNLRDQKLEGESARESKYPKDSC